MGYIYRHIRLDTNEIFYIGLGGFDKTEKEGTYKRAFNKRRRNKIWNNIVSKTDYEVEIMLDDLTLEQAQEKEKEFIKLYGRKDLGLGTLANMTDGGDGAIGLIPWNKNIKGYKGKKHTDETKKLISEKNKGKKHTDETKLKFSESHKGIKYPDRKKLSEEDRKKLSEAHKGKPSPKKGKSKYTEEEKKQRHKDSVKKYKERKKLLN